MTPAAVAGSANRLSNDHRDQAWPARSEDRLRRNPPHLAALVADGTVRPSEGSQPLPKPAKLRGSGKSASDYVSEGRR